MSFLLIDKPAGITSNGVISHVKKHYDISKVGHSGTLDPFATGLLIIATGGDTKFLDRFLGERKTYSGIIKFGQTTETLDTEGEITETKDVDISQEDVNRIVDKHFTGKISQVPPSFSAIKVNGKKSYELARKGQHIEHKPVERIIYKFKLNKIGDNEFEFKVDVSSGTYIRALARDLGANLEAPAMLTALRRESVGIHSVKDASPVEESKLIDTEDFINLPVWGITDKQMKRTLEGKIMTLETNVEEILVKDDTSLVLMQKQDGLNDYKIKKRIR